MNGVEFMITIWNQREVYIGNPSEELKRILSTLSEHKIKYKNRIFSDSSVHFFGTKLAALDVFNLKDDSSKIYYVYVHKDDHVKVLALLQKDSDAAN